MENSISVLLQLSTGLGNWSDYSELRTCPEFCLHTEKPEEIDGMILQPLLMGRVLCYELSILPLLLLFLLQVTAKLIMGGECLYSL